MAGLWACPQCKVTQFSDEVQTIEIIEPGKEARIEFRGKIRPSRDGTFSCLVCGYTWPGPPEDPTPPGGASVSFLHPIYESGDGDFRGLLDRDAC